MINRTDPLVTRYLRLRCAGLNVSAARNQCGFSAYTAYILERNPKILKLIDRAIAKRFLGGKPPRSNESAGRSSSAPPAPSSSLPAGSPPDVDHDARIFDMAVGVLIEIATEGQDSAARAQAALGLADIYRDGTEWGRGRVERILMQDDGRE